MDIQAIQQAIDRIESCTDRAKDALQAGQVAPELRQCVLDLHQQARTGRTLGDAGALRGAVMRLEQAADKAMAACRSAGQVDPTLQQAVQDAHQQASQLKHQVERETA